MLMFARYAKRQLHGCDRFVFQQRQRLAVQWLIGIGSQLYSIVDEWIV